MRLTMSCADMYELTVLLHNVVDIESITEAASVDFTYSHWADRVTLSCADMYCTL